jgi:hypothetical protein
MKIVSEKPRNHNMREVFLFFSLIHLWNLFRGWGGDGMVWVVERGVKLEGCWFPVEFELGS